MTETRVLPLTGIHNFRDYGLYSVAGGGRVRPGLIAPARAPEPLPVRDRVVLRMWAARLLVQIAEGGMFAFLLYWLRSIAPDYPEHGVANIFSLVLVCAVPLSLLLGRWSDRHSRPVRPLVASAVLCAVGMLVMAAANSLQLAIAGYVLFAIAAAIFLALHASQTLRVLPAPQHRGRDLGVFNLTNTVPGMVMPGLTVMLVALIGIGVNTGSALLFMSARKGDLNAKGAFLIDCPVGGTVGPAREGKLLGFVGR